MFLSLLICFIGIIVMLIATVIILSPMIITIRRSQREEIEIKIGHCLPYVYASIYWLSVDRIFYDKNHELESISTIFDFWKTSKGLYINGKETPDVDLDDEDEYEKYIEEYFKEQDKYLNEQL